VRLPARKVHLDANHACSRFTDSSIRKLNIFHPLLPG
jgi:hypothetical protein